MPTSDTSFGKPDLQGVFEVGRDECTARASLGEEEEVEIKEQEVEESRDAQQVYSSQQRMLKQSELEYEGREEGGKEDIGECGVVREEVKADKKREHHFQGNNRKKNFFFDI